MMVMLTGISSGGGHWPQKPGHLEKGQERRVRGFLTGRVRGVWMVPSNDLLSEQTQSHQLRANTGERGWGFPERKGHGRFL